MRKLFIALVVGLMVCNAAVAAVTTGTFGAPNTAGNYPMTVDSDGTVTVNTGTVFKPGLIIDTALYTNTKTSTNARYLCINVDGNIYANAGSCL